MCLYTRQIEPRIAKSDIVVCKSLVQRDEFGNIIFKSPIQGVVVELNKVIEAIPSSPNIVADHVDLNNRTIYSIYEGVVHASLFRDRRYGDYRVKAIIPKGTEYWINIFGLEIAATKMMITDQLYLEHVLPSNIERELLEEAPTIKGVRVGDYLTDNGNYIHPAKGLLKDHLVGIVCGFYKDNTPIICALHSYNAYFCEQPCSVYTNVTEIIKARCLFNGKEITNKYIDNKYFDKELPKLCPAFEKCLNYRKNTKEKWFLGSLGENMAMLDNAIYLNAAHNITGLGFFIDYVCQFMSCSEYNSITVLGCDLGRYTVEPRLMSKGCRYKMVPFLEQ